MVLDLALKSPYKINTIARISHLFSYLHFLNISFHLFLFRVIVLLFSSNANLDCYIRSSLWEIKSRVPPRLGHERPARCIIKKKRNSPKWSRIRKVRRFHLTFNITVRWIIKHTQCEKGAASSGPTVSVGHRFHQSSQRSPALLRSVQVELLPQFPARH